MTKTTVAPIWQDLERQAYHAYREWHLWLMLRERELSARLKTETPRPKAAEKEGTTRIMSDLTKNFPYRLDDFGVPHADDDHPLTYHVDGGGTAHWFDVVREGETAELHYFRALEQDGAVIHDAHPVMEMSTEPAENWAVEGLQAFVNRGEIQMAQDLARQVATIYGRDFPDPAALPALSPQPEYYFGMGTSPDNSPSLEAVKTWMDGTERRFDTLTLAVYGSYDEAAQDERELEDALAKSGLEAAMNLAEQVAVAGGYLDPQRDDPRLFYAEDAPTDPFATIRARELLLTPNFSDAEVSSDQKTELFRADLAGSSHQLIEPLDSTVNYSFEALPADPWTLELTATKWWRDDQERIVHETLTLNTYPLEEGEIEDATQREIAAIDLERIERVSREQGLEAAMRLAETMAIQEGELKADREDGRLFQEGPSDRFVTLRQIEQEALDVPGLDVEQATSADDAQPAPGSWDELVEANHDLPEEEPRETHYWEVHMRQAQTLDGQSLDHAMFITVYPQLSSNFGEFLNEYGMDDSVYPTHAKTLEMAHFATEQQAEKFEQEFRSYLVPDLLDGPELAPEVAKLEGLSGKWEKMDYQDIVDYMSGERTIVREADDWHLNNPNTEQEAIDYLFDIDF